MIKVFRKIKDFVAFFFHFVIASLVVFSMIIINTVLFVMLFISLNLIFKKPKAKAKDNNSMVIE